MESEMTGTTQFMYCIGQLTVESDIFWDLEFKGYHGLESVNDIPKISTVNLCSQGLTKCELDHYYSLMKHICPLVKDAICFQLISMIMLLDTSSLIEDGVSTVDVMDTPNVSTDSREVNAPSLSHVFNDDEGNISATADYDNNISIGNNTCKPRENKKASIKERFQEINSLQKHYINLLRNRCMVLNNPKLRRLGDTDIGLKSTVLCIKQLAQYITVLMSVKNP